MEKYIPAGALKRIHINQLSIRSNKTRGLNEPPIRVKTRKENLAAHEVDILGPSTVVYSPDKPLSCGARCWIETSHAVALREFGQEESMHDAGDGSVNPKYRVGDIVGCVSDASMKHGEIKAITMDPDGLFIYTIDFESIPDLVRLVEHELELR